MKHSKDDTESATFSVCFIYSLLILGFFCVKVAKTKIDQKEFKRHLLYLVIIIMIMIIIIIIMIIIIHSNI